ncbi:MAG: hypothetical protein Q8L87_04520, partial [Anaerolineales bacterium]|nr:hypothetical protein [Anaerolineales bacterium]
MRFCPKIWFFDGGYSPWSRKRAISAKSTPLGLLYLRGRVELATENKDEAHQTLSKALALS